jgi:hypothetical protein
MVFPELNVETDPTSDLVDYVMQNQDRFDVQDFHTGVKYLFEKPLIDRENNEAMEALNQHKDKRMHQRVVLVVDHSGMISHSFILQNINENDDPNSFPTRVLSEDVITSLVGLCDHPYLAVGIIERHITVQLLGEEEAKEVTQILEAHTAFIEQYS